jgi:hypothetical protein
LQPGCLQFLSNKIELSLIALFIGACATALLKAGGKNALDALQTVSIAGGLVYTIVICFMCVSVWKVMKEEAGESQPEAPQFSCSLLAALDFSSAAKWLNVLTAALFPWFRGGQAAGKVYNQKSWPHMVILALLMYCWIALEIAEIAEDGLAYIGWVVLFVFLAYLAAIRIAIRAKSGIKGSMFEDALAVIFVYPLAVDQMHEHIFFGQDAQEKRRQDKDIGLQNRGQENSMDTHDKCINGGKFEEVHF